MQIAIFGGSFDPPHIGHKKIVDESIKNLQVDKLFVIPTYLNPFKKEFHADGKLRAEWLKKILKDYNKTEVLEYEIEQKRVVPTIETVKYIKELYQPKKIYLIIGSDNLKSLSDWKDYKKLSDIVEFVVAIRGDYVKTDLKKLDINVNISSSELRNELDLRYIPEIIRKEVKEFYGKKN